MDWAIVLISGAVVGPLVFGISYRLFLQHREHLARQFFEGSEVSSQPIGPRLGTGPDAYKEVSDEQVGKWAIEEAHKIESLANRAMKMDVKTPGDARFLMFRFNTEFEDCCAEEVKELRAEILRRLGPPSKDSDEVSAWTALFPEIKYPVLERFGLKPDINPMMVAGYAPYLRRLGLRLKRRAIPRLAPTFLQFSETQTKAETSLKSPVAAVRNAAEFNGTPNQQFPFRVMVTINTKVPIQSGYVVVEFDGRFAGAECDFIDSKLVGPWDKFIENTALADLLSKNVGTIYALQIGKTPFTPEKPIHVVAFGKIPFHVSKVTLFAE
jgi:hypothetical protein